MRFIQDRIVVRQVHLFRAGYAIRHVADRLEFVGDDDRLVASVGVLPIRLSRTRPSPS
jgi:hypothetical protein